MQADFTVENHGSVFLLRLLTDSAKTWVGEYLPEDCIHFGNAVAVEHRYILDIVDGIIADGLTVN